MSSELIKYEDNQQGQAERVMAPRRRGRLTAIAAGAGALMTATLAGAYFGPRIFSNDTETQANIEAALPQCGKQKDGTKELVITAEREAVITVRPGESPDRFIKLVIGLPGDMTVKESPGAEQPPLRPGQDGDSKNFDFSSDLRLNIDPDVEPWPGDRTRLVISKEC